MSVGSNYSEFFLSVNYESFILEWSKFNLGWKRRDFTAMNGKYFVE